MLSGLIVNDMNFPMTNSGEERGHYTTNSFIFFGKIRALCSKTITLGGRMFATS